MHEAEPLGEFIGNETAQRDVVYQPDKADCGNRLFSRCTLRHVTGDDHDFGFQIEPPGGVVEADSGARRQKFVAAALVHQRVCPETGG